MGRPISRSKRGKARSVNCIQTKCIRHRTCPTWSYFSHAMHIATSCTLLGIWYDSPTTWYSMHDLKHGRVLRGVILLPKHHQKSCYQSLELLLMDQRFFDLLYWIVFVWNFRQDHEIIYFCTRTYMYTYSYIHTCIPQHHIQWLVSRHHQGEPFTPLSNPSASDHQ